MSIAYRNKPRPFSLAALDRVYEFPNPTRSMEEFRRLHHLDLEALDYHELQRERRCVQLRADLDGDRTRRAWLTSRLAAIDRERGSRRRQMTAAGSQQRFVTRSNDPTSSGPKPFEYRRGKVVER